MFAENILSLPEKGRTQHQEFLKDRLQTRNVAFHDPIKRNANKGFGTNTKKTVLSNKKSIDVNRDILAKLLSISTKQQEKKIDLEKALTYPLSEVPLSLCNADGSMRKTNTSKLAK